MSRSEKPFFEKMSAEEIKALRKLCLEQGIPEDISGQVISESNEFMNDELELARIALRLRDAPEYQRLVMLKLLHQWWDDPDENSNWIGCLKWNHRGCWHIGKDRCECACHK